jgi:hypothetical protein
MESPATKHPEYYCRGCGAGLTQEDVETGRAVIRFGETYCYRCFRKKFPKDCPNHPEVKATRGCSKCHVKLCEDCLVDIQGKSVCRRCKQRVLAELIVGPVKPGSGRRTRRQPPSAVLAAGILGFFCCGGFGILTLWGYYNHRRDVAEGLARRSRIADAGLIIGLIWLVLFVIAFLTGFLGTILN